MRTHSRAFSPVLIVTVALVGLALLVTARLASVPAPPSSSSSGASPQDTPASAGASPAATPLATPEPTPGEAILLAAGDVAWCDGTADDLVGELASRLEGTIALLGDNAYPDGSSADYANCFDPIWGPMRSRIRPVPGNHDYQTSGASGYFGYFGAAAGTAGAGWYSYDLGAWHVIALNSECGAVGCGSGSPQLAWLLADLGAHPAACTLAYWHHPRYSSGLHGDDAMTDALWRALASGGADIVLAGHDHDYERIGLIDGIRSFIVGTGGRSLYDWPGSPGALTEVRANDTYGLLELSLGEDAYSWRFVPAEGGSFTDSGESACR